MMNGCQSSMLELKLLHWTRGTIEILVLLAWFINVEGRKRHMSTCQFASTLIYISTSASFNLLTYDTDKKSSWGLSLWQQLMSMRPSNHITKSHRPMKPAEIHILELRQQQWFFLGNTHAKMRSADIKRNCISEECKVAGKLMDVVMEKLNLLMWFIVATLMTHGCQQTQPGRGACNWIRTTETTPRTARLCQFSQYEHMPPHHPTNYLS